MFHDGTPGLNRSSGVNTTPGRTATGRYAHRDAHGGARVGDLLRHYDDPERLYNITMPRQAFALGGFQLHDRAAPRGQHGLDAMEAHMRQMRSEQAELAAYEEQERRQAKALAARDELERQRAEKQAALDRQRAAEMAEDIRRNERAPYGPAHDQRRALQEKMRKRELLKAKLEEQQRDKAMRDAFEAQHLAAPPEDWAAGLRHLDDRIRKAKDGDVGTAVPLSEQQQQRAGPKVIQDARESAVVKKEEEEKPLSREVAFFADRILMSERARKDNQSAYRAELDVQVRENFHRRSTEVAANLIIDRSYHIGMSLPGGAVTQSHAKLMQYREQAAAARASSAGATTATRRNNMHRANDSHPVAATLFGEMVAAGNAAATNTNIAYSSRMGPPQAHEGALSPSRASGIGSSSYAAAASGPAPAADRWGGRDKIKDKWATRLRAPEPAVSSIPWNGRW